MKISILENDLSAIGGRQQTMVSGFADCFTSMGHKVKVYATFTGKHITQKENLLMYHVANNLKLENFYFLKYVNKPRSLLRPSGLPVKKINDSDILLISNPSLSNIGKHVDRPIISWYIAKPQNWNSQNISRIWTNSYTQRKLLDIEEASVVYAPHNYSIFREKAKTWDERDIDILIASSIIKSKENSHSLKDDILKLNNLKNMCIKVVGLFIIREQEELDFVDELNFETHINVRRRDVAKFMGRSRILYHPSPVESCSLVIYEAMNAGMYPIVRGAGACREQMGSIGYVFDDFEEFKSEAKQALSSNYDPAISIQRGLLFDRRNNIDLIEAELNSVVE